MKRTLENIFKIGVYLNGVVKYQTYKNSFSFHIKSKPINIFHPITSRRRTLSTHISVKWMENDLASSVNIALMSCNQLYGYQLSYAKIHVNSFYRNLYFPNSRIQSNTFYFYCVLFKLSITSWITFHHLFSIKMLIKINVFSIFELYFFAFH